MAISRTQLVEIATFGSLFTNISANFYMAAWKYFKNLKLHFWVDFWKIPIISQILVEQVSIENDSSRRFTFADRSIINKVMDIFLK